MKLWKSWADDNNNNDDEGVRDNIKCVYVRKKERMLFIERSLEKHEREREEKIRQDEEERKLITKIRQR